MNHVNYYNFNSDLCNIFVRLGCKPLGNLRHHPFEERGIMLSVGERKKIYICLSASLPTSFRIFSSSEVPVLLSVSLRDARVFFVFLFFVSFLQCSVVFLHNSCHLIAISCFNLDYRYRNQFFYQLCLCLIPLLI